MKVHVHIFKVVSKAEYDAKASTVDAAQAAALAAAKAGKLAFGESEVDHIAVPFVDNEAKTLVCAFKDGKTCRSAGGLKMEAMQIDMTYKCESSADKRVSWHLTVPACRIWRGLKTHISLLSLKERWHLCHLFRCETARQLERIMWKLIKLRKKAG